jgi:hypothetical protein
MVSQLPKQTLGKDFNHFERITVDGYVFADYADTQFLFRFSNLTFSLVWEGTGVIEYSFNGETVHGDMENGQPTQAIFFDDRVVPGIWFRLVSGAGGDVRIEGWAK